jgi:hypothetical protein
MSRVAAQAFLHSEEVVHHRGADVEVGHRQVAGVEDLFRDRMLDRESETRVAYGLRDAPRVGLRLQAESAQHMHRGARLLEGGHQVRHRGPFVRPAGGVDEDSLDPVRGGHE